MKTIHIKRPHDLARLQRSALAAQGLLQAKPFGKGLVGARNAIGHLGYVQIDTISVVERAHHHVIHSRVPNFKPAMTNKMLRDGDIFEYWSHAAAFLPIADFRFSLPYKHAIRNGQTHWYKNPDQKLMKTLLARVRSEGPLRSRDLESKANKKGGGWWDWKPAKKALEQLYMQGELMVCDRENFQKTYDLSERVLPQNVNTQMPSVEEFAVHLVEQQLRCHGFASLKGLTYLRRNPGLRKAVKALVNERVFNGDYEQLQLASGECFVAEAGVLERPLQRLPKQLLILSPFDNCLIQRDRLKSLFQFEYQIECYLPEVKRRYGYFCLPLLYRGTFVGRMDCKAHRKERQLEIKSLHIEQQGFEWDELAADFAKAIISFCQFQNCDSVVLAHVTPKKQALVLRRALADYK